MSDLTDAEREAWDRNPDEWPHTPPLHVFRALMDEDDNTWWRAGSGHGLNAYEAAIDALAAAEARAARLAEVVGDATPYLLPRTVGGKTYADADWWAGKVEHGPPQHPTTLAEAEALTWARCWAYIDEHNLPAEVCHHIWPLVTAALHADRAALAAPASVPESSATGAVRAERGER